MTSDNSNGLLAFGLGFFRDLLLVIYLVRLLLCALLVLLDDLQSQLWFHRNLSWSPRSQLWFVSLRLMLVLYVYLLMKQIKVGFVEINLGFDGTKVDFASRQAEQEVRRVIAELSRLQGEDLEKTRDQMQEDHWNCRLSLLWYLFIFCFS